MKRKSREKILIVNKKIVDKSIRQIDSVIRNIEETQQTIVMNIDDLQSVDYYSMQFIENLYSRLIAEVSRVEELKFRILSNRESILRSMELIQKADHFAANQVKDLSNLYRDISK